MTTKTISGSTSLNVSSGATDTIASGGVDSSYTVFNGGVLVVTAGGSATGGTLNAGGTILDAGTVSGLVVDGSLVVSSGGVLNGGTIVAGGSVLNKASALVENTVVNGGALEFQGVVPNAYANTGVTFGASGGTISLDSGFVYNAGNTTAVTSGGTVIVNSGALLTSAGIASAVVIVNSGGSATSDTVSAGGTLLAGSGGVVSAATVVRGGLLTVNSGGSVQGATVASGGVLNETSGGVLLGTETVASAGSVVLNGPSAGGTLAFTSGSEVILSGGVATYTTVVSGFTSGSLIDLANVASSSITSVSASGNTVTITTTGGTYTLDVLSAGTLGHTLVSDGKGGTFYEVCFAEGTMIATPGGEAAVEALRVGDLVATLNGPQPVTWMGYRSVDVSTLREPETGRLVRIRQGAFGDGVPHRDLLITPEHCVFVEGRLIPARMLVNRRSIVVDYTISSYSYYHVELEQHGILFAEGLMTESYFDTGNRSNFAGGEATAIRPSFAENAGHRSWADAAAPLAVDRDTVEPVWRMLDSRATTLGFPPRVDSPTLTEDADLHLVTETGTIIRPVDVTDDRYFFLIPDDATGLRIRSRTFRPSEVEGPFVDDRRTLGVKVGQMSLTVGRDTYLLSPHLDGHELEGWSAPEGGAARWTTGAATLPLDAGLLHWLMAGLSIEVVANGSYLTREAADGSESARAA